MYQVERYFVGKKILSFSTWFKLVPAPSGENVNFCLWSYILKSIVSLFVIIFNSHLSRNWTCQFHCAHCFLEFLEGKVVFSWFEIVIILCPSPVLLTMFFFYFHQISLLHLFIRTYWWIFLSSCEKQNCH